MTDFKKLFQALRLSWSAETSYNPDEWSEANPARGQCVVSVLIVQDYLGGELGRYKMTLGENAETHYFNVLEDKTLIDTTFSQYTDKWHMEIKPINKDVPLSIREKRLSDADTKRRYEILKKRVEDTLVHL